MPAGFHVASAYVDIHAEDAGLRGEIKRAIEGAVAGENGKIKLNVDTAGLRSKISSAVNAAGTGQKVKVGVNVDTAGLRSKVSAAMNAAGANQKVKVSTNLDTAGLRSKVSAAIAAAGTGQKVKVGLKLDTAGFRAAVSAAVSAAGTGQNVHVGMKVDTAGLRAGVSAAVAGAGAGQNVHVGVDVDRGTLSRAQGALRSFSNDSNRILGGGGGGGGGSFLSKRTGLGGLNVGSVLAGLSMLEPALGALIAPAQALGTASAALVPAFLGTAVAATALIVGSKGVGKAMKASNKDAVDYGSALNNLAPSAQEFVQSTSKMGGAFDQMRLGTQQALFAGLGNEVTKLGGSALPIMSAGLASMAGVMNTAFKGVTGTLDKLAGNGQLGALFGGLTTAFKPLAAIPGQFVDMLTKVGIAASPLLTRITKGIAGGMTNMTDKIGKAFESGQLQAKIDKAGASIGRFFTNFKNNGAVQQFWDNLKTQGPAAAKSLQKIGEAGLTLLNSSSGVGAALLKIGGAAATLVNAIPPSMLSGLMLVASGMRAISLVGAGLGKANAAIRGLGASLTGVGTGQQITRQATALRGLSGAATTAGTALATGGLSAAAIRRQAAALAGGGIAASQMGGRMAAAGTVVGTFGATAGTTASKLTALKVGGLAVAGAFIAMKGTDALMDKIFGKPANVSQMAQGFKEFAATGNLTGITAKTLGDNFGKFGEAVQKVAHNDPIGKIKNSLARGFAWTGLDSFKDKNKDLVNSVDDTLAALVKSGNSSTASKLFDNLAKGAEKSGTSVGKLKSMMGDYNKALKEQATAEKIAAASMGTFGTEAIKTQKVLGKNAGEVKGLAGSYNALGQFNQSAIGAQLGFNSAVSQAHDALKKSSNALGMTNGVLQTTTPTAQKAAGALLGIASAAQKSGEAFTAKGDMAQVVKTYSSARKEIEGMAKAQGLNATQAREFVNQILPMPNVAKLMHADVANTAKAMTTLTGALQKAPKNQKLFNFDPQTFQSTARAALTAVGAQVKTLSSGKMQVKVDTADAKSKVESLGKVFSALSKGTKEIKLPAADIGKVTGALEKAGMSVTKLKDGKVKITAEDGASVVIDTVKKKVAELNKPVKIPVGAQGNSATVAEQKAKQLEESTKKVGTATDNNTGKQKNYNATVQKILNDPRLQAHGRGQGGLGAAVGPSSDDTSKLQTFSAAMQKLAAGGKNVQVAVSISGTEQIDKLTALNAVKNKNIQVAVNISGTEDIEKLTALNAVNNKNIQVAVNISGTEQIDKLQALNAVDNKFIQVQVQISGTEQIDKLKALNEVNNKSIIVSVSISGTEQIDKLKALNEVNNKSIQVSVSISGTEQIDKLKALNEVNNKSVSVSVSITGTEQIDKLKELNNVSNKSISVNVNISGADQISKLKELNNVNSKSITITATVTGAAQAATLKSAIDGVKSKTATITVTANAGPINSIKSAIAGVVSKHVTVTATANAGPVNALKSAISSVQGKSVTVTANVNGLGAVQALIGAIAAVQSKTVTITVNTVKTGSAAGGGMMSHKTLPGFASGGRSMTGGGNVNGIGTTTSDSILARLSNGEFVIRASMVKKYGPEMLAAINHGAFNTHANHIMANGALKRFSTGGQVSLSNVQPGDSGSEVLLLQKALKQIYPDFDYSSGPGTFGPRTKAAYSNWQKSLGYSGSGANGSPGIASLVALANRTGEFSVKASNNVISYVIKWGDTLTSIARKFGTSVDELVKLNNIKDPNKIYAGSSLKIPSGAYTPPPIPSVIPGTKPGDWNYLAPPKFSKIAAYTQKDTGGTGTKDAEGVNTIKELVDGRNHLFSQFSVHTNSADLVTKINEATDVKGLAEALDSMRVNIYDAFKPGKGRDALQNYTHTGGDILLKYEKNMVELNKTIEDAKKTQEDLKSSYKSLTESVQQTVMSFGSLVKTGKAGASTETMIRQMTKDAGTTTQFSQGLETLRGRGLSGEALAQIGAAGPVEGLRTINSLLQATPAQIAQLNALQTQVTQNALKTGTTAADAMYGAGVAAASGFVDGLEAQKGVLQEAMKQIAEAMKLAIRQSLGIASPSRVMHGYGMNIIQGLVRGMSAEGKTVPEIVKALAEQIQFNGHGGSLGTITPGAGTGSLPNPGEGGIHVHGGIHIHIDGSNMDLKTREDVEKFAQMVGPEIIKVIREENRKRS